MASTASEKVAVNGVAAAQGAPGSDPDRALQRLPGGNNLSPVIIAAMTADMMRTLQFAAVRAFRVRFTRQRLVTATHATAGRRGLSLGYSHWDNAPFTQRRAV